MTDVFRTEGMRLVMILVSRFAVFLFELTMKSEFSVGGTLNDQEAKNAHDACCAIIYE
jgi:hypothetical protein